MGRSVGTDRAKSALADMYKGQLQAPLFLSIDRCFVSSSHEPFLPKTADIWIFEGRGSITDNDDAVVACHLAGTFSYRLSMKTNEYCDCTRHRLERLFLMKTGRVMTWKGVEVIRGSRKPGSLRKIKSIIDFVKQGIKVGIIVFPLDPTSIREAPIP